MNYRVGQGYDLHQLVENKKLIIGGIHIPFEKGLKGHSDADVLIHAICDAILGSIGKGDIGSLFPDSKEENKDRNSIEFLLEVKSILKNNGYAIVNIDTTLILEKPKIGLYSNQIKNNISRVLELDLTQISIKAKTSEGLGFIGNGEAIAAQAVVLVHQVTS